VTAQRAIRLIVHSFFAYLAMAIGTVVSVLLAVVVPAIGSNQTFLGHVVSEPIWGMQILAGFLAGRALYKYLPSRVALAAWVIPGILLLWNVLSWRTMSKYDSAWDTFFGNGCSSSECLDQLLLTAPFYTAVAYSLGAFLARSRKGTPVAEKG